MSRLIVAIVLVISVTYAKSAQAQESEKTPEAWYGWQTLGADAMAWGLLFVGLRVHDDGNGTAARLLYAGAAVTYLAASPAIHARHSRGHSAVVSGIVRFSFPLVGIAVGMVAGETITTHEESGPDEGAMLGGLVGMIVGVGTAQLLDWIYLSRPGSQSRVAVVPTGRGFALAGTF